MATKQNETRKTVRIPIVGQGFRTFDELNVLNTTNVDQQFENGIFQKHINPAFGEASSAWYTYGKRPTFVDLSDTYGTSGGQYCHLDSISTLRYSSLAGGGGLVFAVVGIDGGNNSLHFSTNAGDEATVVPTGNPSTQYSRIARLAHTKMNNGNEAVITWHQRLDLARTNCQAFIYDHIADTITEITDADFPDTTLIGSFVYMNGYTFVMTTDGKIYNSSLNDPTAWDATAYISTSFPSGSTGFGIARWKEYIVAFSSTSIEFFKHVGNATGSVLQAVPELTIYNYGIDRLTIAASGTSYVTDYTSSSFRYFSANNTLYWINSIQLSSGGGVFMLNASGKPEKVSSAELTGLMSNYQANDRDWEIAGTLNILGDPYLVVNHATGSLYGMFLINLTTGLWTTWKFPLSSWYRLSCIQTGTTRTVWFSNVYTGTPSFGSLSAKTLTFAGDSTYDTNPLMVQTRLLDFDTNKRKRIDKVRIVGNAASGNVSLSWTKDDYTNFTTARTAPFSDNAATFTNLGMGRRWGFRIAHSAAAYCQIDWLEIEYTELDK